MFISEFKITNYVYNMCTFQNIVMNSFDNCNTTETLIRRIFFVYRNTSSQTWMPLFTIRLEPFIRYEIFHLEEVLLECQQADFPIKYKRF